MISYPLPADLTREQFHSLVTDIYYRLSQNGLDPVHNMVIGDRDELADDGIAHGVFTIFVSDDAALMLAQISH
jgi:hypothetical protein